MTTFNSCFEPSMLSSRRWAYAMPLAPVMAIKSLIECDRGARASSPAAVFEGRGCAQIAAGEDARAPTPAFVQSLSANYDRRKRPRASFVPPAKRNAACCDKKLVVSKRIGKSNIVHVPYCRALVAVTAFL